MKITIVYDNKTRNPELRPDWGFACLVEAHGKTILFDAGENGSILLQNMDKLSIDPSSIEEVFISHDHHDHTGGLSAFLAKNKCRVLVPISCREFPDAAETVKIDKPCKIHEGIFSTGELKSFEQSLVVQSDKGAVVVAGCSHPGVGTILETASQFGNVNALIGGLHGFSDFYLIGDLEMVCPTHCTQFKARIKSMYPAKYIEGGAGVVMDI